MTCEDEPEEWQTVRLPVMESPLVSAMRQASWVVQYFLRRGEGDHDLAARRCRNYTDAQSKIDQAMLNTAWGK